MYVNAKKIPNRNDVQLHLVQVLNTANNIYNDSIASNFPITLGDEFQVLLSNASKIFEIVDFIKYSLYPIQLRFGIGIGDMSTSFQQTTSIGSDGPAYWAARQAISTVHENNQGPLIRIELDTSKGLANQAINNAIQQTLSQTINVINSTLAICEQQESSWTRQQADFVARLIQTYKYGNYIEYTTKQRCHNNLLVYA